MKSTPVLSEYVQNEIQKACFLGLTKGGQKAIMDAVMGGQTPKQIEEFIFWKLGTTDMPAQKIKEMGNNYFLAARHAGTLCRATSTAGANSDHSLETTAPHAV